MIASGFILNRMEAGETALNSNLVKEEVAIWLSRYKRSKLADFLDNIQEYTSLTIEPPTMEDQAEAERHLGTYPLGYLDSVSLAMMNRNQVSAIYTSDKGFDRVPGIRRVLEDACDDPKFINFKK